MNVFGIKLHIFFILIATALLQYRCSKDDCDVIPESFVNITINLNHFALGTGSSMTINNSMAGIPGSLGYNNNGIILYRAAIDEFYAYDRTCTLHLEDDRAVNIDSNPLFGKCPKCESKFQLWFSGFPTDEGPAICPLKQYKTSYNPNNGELHIFNF